MARFRLRYQSTDLEMPPGEFVVGRSSSCHLALDDALVSRRHAVFHVTHDGVEVEDLGSRNGISINGEQVRGRRALKHLDRVIIGTQELLLMRVQSDERERHNRPTLAGLTLDLPVMRGDAPDEPTVHRTESVLDRIADKALALGRFEEAERMLVRRLQELMADAQAGRPPSEDKLTAGSTYALKLAEGTKKAGWVDWIFQIHDAADRLLDADTIEKLHDLVRKIRYPGSRAFRDYMENMRQKAAGFAPRQRFLLQRLESLERVIGA
ncbi:MAG: FHA domain-containing protein [Sandaracinaceae bacterium]|nr:FHA domain-containing protein [Sandaracinaceae bacterium]